MNGRSLRWGGVAGLVAVAAFIASSTLLRHSPSTDQPTRDITAWFAAERGSALTAAYLLGLGATVLLFFVAALRRRLRQDDDLDAVASAALAGGIGVSVTTLLAGTLIAVLAFRPDTTPEVARALYDANGLMVAFTAFLAAALVCAASVVALRRDGSAGPGSASPLSSSSAPPRSSGPAGSCRKATPVRFPRRLQRS